MTDPQYDELEPQRGHMAPLWVRRVFGFLGVNTYTDDHDEE